MVGSTPPRSPPKQSSREQRGPPALVVVSLEALAASIQTCPALVDHNGQPLPEELACLLFERVLEKGKLTPKVLDVFESTEHEALMERIRALGITKWTPPLLPLGRDGPIGYSRPAWE